VDQNVGFASALAPASALTALASLAAFALGTLRALAFAFTLLFLIRHDANLLSACGGPSESSASALIVSAEGSLAGGALLLALRCNGV
jgi:hypothetical protein